DQPFPQLGGAARLLQEEVEEEVARAGDGRPVDVAAESALREVGRALPEVEERLVARAREVARGERAHLPREPGEVELEALPGREARGEEERDHPEGLLVELGDAEVDLDLPLAEDERVEDVLGGARHLAEPLPEVLRIEVRPAKEEAHVAGALDLAEARRLEEVVPPALDERGEEAPGERRHRLE